MEIHIVVLYIRAPNAPEPCFRYLNPLLDLGEQLANVIQVVCSRCENYSQAQVGLIPAP